jgi:fatty-acyl-CoA synthase
VLQEYGYASVLGRIKDLIIRNGDKIFPSVSEGFFEAHLDIIEAQLESFQQLSLLMCW